MMRVLVVSPRFPPTSAADLHRIRLLAPYMHKEGCEVEILAVAPESLNEPMDEMLAERIPADVPVHRVRLPGKTVWTLRSLWLRSLRPLFRRGTELLASGRFDLVFFSTTEFPLHVLGPWWKRRFGVPFCMDFQDPWVNDYYRRNPRITPPGGRLKYAIAESLDRVLEPFVVARCAGFLAVSEDYLQTLVERYGRRVASKPQLVKAFPAEPLEHAAAGQDEASGSDGPVWRYVGRGGADMAFAVRAFMNACKGALDAGVLPPAWRFEAVGTSYAPPPAAERTLAPEAAAAGIGRHVTEKPARIPYRDVMSLLQASDALIVFGSDDPAYTASKIYPYLLARKPLLAIFHERSSVNSLMRQVGGGICVTYDQTMSVEELTERIREHWFENKAYERAVRLDDVRFAPFTAQHQAADVTRWFECVLAGAEA